ncbi:MAG: butyrate kinase [Bacteriovoracaceae bacterium]|nr:butyrate kinase [Bacteriovoracaceae bacterium]
MSFKILVINPGSTSTKIALFDGTQQVITKKIDHLPHELSKFETVLEQIGFRTKLITDTLSENNFMLSTLDAVVGRGGILKPIKSGTYLVNDKMIEDLSTGRAFHACNLGAFLARDLAKMGGCRPFVVDPVVVDEFEPLARYTGSKHLERQSIFHALNHKAVARVVASKLGKKYEECNFVLAHLGGGISVAAHKLGKVIDVNNALDGDGPFTPERSGGLPTGQWLELIDSKEFQKSELKKMMVGNGGFMSYLNTTDNLFIEKKIDEGDAVYKEVQDAMCYQVAKEIGAYSTVLCGQIDRIILTGGLAFSQKIVQQITKRTQWIAPICVVAGENEMEALWLGGKRVLEETEIPLVYS